MMNKQATPWLWMTTFGATLVFLSACSTVPDPYIPSHIGAKGASAPQNGLAVSITAHDDSVYIGDPVSFRVSIRNHSTNAVWVSRHPQMIFYWIYPNGLHDNYVREYPDEIHYRKSDVTLLPPKKQMVFEEVIDTFYFPKPGIVEFRAEYISSSNTNSDIKPFWKGTLLSNSYGVEIKPRPPKRSGAVASTFL
jgi:hypothetical protein